MIVRVLETNIVLGRGLLTSGRTPGRTTIFSPEGEFLVLEWYVVCSLILAFRSFVPE